MKLNNTNKLPACNSRDIFTIWHSQPQLEAKGPIEEPGWSNVLRQAASWLLWMIRTFLPKFQIHLLLWYWSRYCHTHILKKICAGLLTKNPMLAFISLKLYFMVNTTNICFVQQRTCRQHVTRKYFVWFVHGSHLLEVRIIIVILHHNFKSFSIPEMFQFYFPRCIKYLVKTCTHNFTFCEHSQKCAIAINQDFK